MVTCAGTGELPLLCTAVFFLLYDNFNICGDIFQADVVAKSCVVNLVNFMCPHICAILVEVLTMAVSESQLRASKKYHAKFERLYIRITPESKIEIDQHAEKMNESVNAFVQRAIAETIERDNAKK